MGTSVLVVDKNDLEKICNGENFIHILRKKYEANRFDL